MRRSLSTPADRLTPEERAASLCGMESFQSLIHDLDRLANNRRRYPAMQIQLPTYLIAAEDGCSPLTCVDILAEQLKRHDLFYFNGRHSWFGWKLSADEEWSFERLLYKLDEEAGFSSCYHGIVALDIDSLVDRNSEILDDLIRLTQDTRGEILFVYLIRMKGEQRLNDLMRRLGQLTMLEILRLQLPSEEQMASHVTRQLADAGFVITGEAKTEVPHLISAMRKVSGFGGGDSLDRLADAIAYRAVTTRVMQKRAAITAEDINYFLTDNHCTLHMTRGNDHRTIGFGG